MSKFSELEVVRLREPFLPYGLKAGAEGTIVWVHDGGAAFDVEFADDNGETIALATLTESALEATGKADP